MNIEKISKDFVCKHRDYLPCEYHHLDGDVHRCSYDRLWVLAALINQDEELADGLTEQACPPNKEEDALRKQRIKIHQENARNIMENAHVGDTVFCLLELLDESILVEKPKSEGEHAFYQNKDGQIRSCLPGALIRISKGNFMGEYFYKSEGKHIREYSDSEFNCLMVKRMALQAGFRVEIHEAKTDAGSGHTVKIYGDSQQEVDDFMTYCVYNKLILY